jgi:hypothetical protein
MTIPIVRVYETDKQARDAVGNLREEGFPKDTIFLIHPASKSEGETVEPLSMATKAGYVPQREATHYARILEQGRSVVSIRAPFGQGRLATDILERYDPISDAIPSEPKRTVAWEVGAPLSSALLLPTLLKSKPDAFSMSFGFPTLSTRRTSQYQQLTNPDYALFGASRLSRNPAPLSSIFKIKTLSSKPGGPSWRSSFGIRLLSSDPTPLSSKLGMLVLRDKRRPHEPAPLSANLGLPTLSRGRTFLSRLFGELTSPNFALFGRNPLIAKAAPLSSLFGLSTISGKSGPSWSSSFGIPLLTSGQGPVLSTLPQLSRNPAPLSSLLGLRVLSIYQ